MESTPVRAGYLDCTLYEQVVPATAVANTAFLTSTTQIEQGRSLLWPAHTGLSILKKEQFKSPRKGLHSTLVSSYKSSASPLARLNG